MMFVLYHAKHDAGCSETHIFTTGDGSKRCRTGKRKKFEVGPEEMIDLERDALANLQISSHLACQEDWPESDALTDSHADTDEFDEEGTDHEAGHFVVDRILDEKFCNGKRHDRISWIGHGDVIREPEEHLSECSALNIWEEQKALKSRRDSTPTLVDACREQHLLSSPDTEFISSVSSQPQENQTPSPYEFEQRCVDFASSESKGFFNIVCGAGKTLIMERILSNVRHDLAPEVICYDEAHRYTSPKWLKILGGDAGDEVTTEEATSEDEPDDPDEESCLELFNQDLVAKAKKFFFTATPTPQLYKHDKIFGKELLRYTHKQGVEDRIVKNFDTVIKFYRQEGTPIEDETVCYRQKIHSVKSLVEEQDLKRILVYTRFVVDSDTHVATVEGFAGHQSLFPPHYRLHFVSAPLKI
ncbi:hypothetical protein HDV00_009818 [Rhizophlyctis rosea]|nr:hypothetical protein HDV00_009818 [Rhizophlyctis rosea]